MTWGAPGRSYDGSNKARRGSNRASPVSVRTPVKLYGVMNAERAG
jgi:hypothetical protein